MKINTQQIVAFDLLDRLSGIMCGSDDCILAGVQNIINAWHNTKKAGAAPQEKVVESNRYAMTMLTIEEYCASVGKSDGDFVSSFEDWCGQRLVAPELASNDERYKQPPCLDCGAKTKEEAETMCICAGDKDHCHGCDLWPDA